jgi:uncharacterized membrane protein YgcG
MINLVTWTGANGYSSILWSSLTEISIFHVWINQDGSLSYDGNLTNLGQEISTAHSHNVKVTLAVGGQGESIPIINEALSNSSFQTTVINNIINQVVSQNYDGVQMDFENNLQCDFNSTQYTTFIQRLYNALQAKNPNYVLSVTYASWESCSINPVAMEPYVNHILVMFNMSVSYMNGLGAQLKDPSKLSCGYDFQDDPETPAALLPKLKACIAAGYGVFFWQAATANQSYYNDILQALGTNVTAPSSSTSTTTSSTTTTKTTLKTTTTVITSGATTSIPRTTTPTTSIPSTTSATTTVKSGGGSSGSSLSSGGGGRSGGGGTLNPLVTYTNGCAEITNVSYLSQFGFEISNQNYSGAVDNYIGSNLTSVILGGASYTLYLNSPTQISSQAYLKLLYVSWLPVQHSVTLEACPINPSSSSTLGTTSTFNTTSTIGQNSSLASNGIAAGLAQKTPPSAGLGASMTGATGTQSGANYLWMGLIGALVVIIPMAGFAVARSRIMYAPDLGTELQYSLR